MDKAPDVGRTGSVGGPAPPPRVRGPLSRVARMFESGRRSTSRHRDVQGNAGRAAVLGAGDGLLTNISLILGVAGANPGAGTVRLAGVAGLLAGAFSMAAGELVSVRAQDELVEHEVDVERDEISEDPVGERKELAALYQAEGVAESDAQTVARILMANPSLALDTHARLELGVDPNRGGSANQAALASFLSFATGAIIPLFPWFFLTGTVAITTSIAVGIVAALGLGAAIGAFTGRSRLRTALRQLSAATIAATITYGVGALLGVSTH
jgi:VIT1/CCC1 family predicted Fe2+/Mn2+ transporter